MLRPPGVLCNELGQDCRLSVDPLKFCTELFVSPRAMYAFVGFGDVRALAISLAALFMAIGSPVRTHGEPRPLTVRLYNSAGIPSGDFGAARIVAESVLRDTGLDVHVRHCGRQGAPSGQVDPCHTRLEASEVVVRIIDAPVLTAVPQVDAYGVAYVVDETERGWLATVFADRTHDAAMRTGVEWGALLGRVTAHEVGHLILGNGYHGAVGVMRADWPDALLSRTGEDWRFSLPEAAAFRQSRSPIQ
jgi:hypothetical protein